MKLFYLVGNDGAGKTTLISLIAYNLFLRNYRVGILDLTDRGSVYFFRFGVCDFFALDDCNILVPQRLLVTLQDIGDSMRERPRDSLQALPLMPGLKICLTAPSEIREKLLLAESFLEIYHQDFDFVFVEISPPLHLLQLNCGEWHQRVFLICEDNEEKWPGMDRHLEMFAQMPRQMKVVLNKQREGLIAATRFVEKNNLGVDFILDHAGEVLANSSVMEMCKQVAHCRFLQQLVPFISALMLDGAGKTELCHSSNKYATGTFAIKK